MVPMIAEINTEQRDPLLGVLLFVFVMVIAVGMWLLSVIGTSSPRRRLQGTYVLAYMAIGYAMGIIYWFIFQGDFHDRDEVPGVPLFCMLAGWAVGMTHGAMAVWWRFRRTGSSAH